MEVDTVRHVLRPVFLLARCICIPYFELRFQVFSIWTIAIISLIFCNAFLGILSIIKHRPNLNFADFGFFIGEVSFYWITTLYFCVFQKMSIEWPTLRYEWERMEAFMSGLPPVRVSLKIALITLFYSTGALVEHMLSVLDGVKSWEEGNVIQVFLLSSFAQLSGSMEFTVVKAFFHLIVNTLIAVVWNFADIFIITTSLALSARLQQLYVSIEHAMSTEMPENFWRQSRQRYSKISNLTQHLNEKLSFVILLSLSNNLYNICLMLFRTLKYGVSLINISYYITSFGLVLLRVFGVCVAADKIYSTSKSILSLLFSVSSKSYNSEVERFIIQVKDESLSLHCWKFFRLTRSLFLNIAGTIVTYEVVLLQFNPSPSNTKS